MISTASDIPSHNKEVSEFIQEFLNYLHQLFSNIFDQMKVKNELSADSDSKALADFMIGNVFGFWTLCRAQAPKSLIQNHMHGILGWLELLSERKA
jgi:hypothetical protein